MKILKKIKKSIDDWLDKEVHFYTNSGYLITNNYTLLLASLIVILIFKIITGKFLT